MEEMIINKLQELGNDQEFAAKMQAAESAQDMLSVLAEYGIEATEEALVKALACEAMTTEDGELSEEMLGNVSGGGKVWDWGKSRFNNWFKKQSDKNARDLERLAR